MAFFFTADDDVPTLAFGPDQLSHISFRAFLVRVLLDFSAASNKSTAQVILCFCLKLLPVCRQWAFVFFS